MSQVPAKILVVDDEPNVLLTAREILMMEQYDVDAVGDASTALSCLAQTSYDLVLTDLKMKGMDGLELLAEIQMRSPQTVTVMITGYGSVDSAIDAVRNGAYEYLLKPVAVEDLKQAVRRCLERKRFSEIDTLYKFGAELVRARTPESVEKAIEDASHKVLGTERVLWSTVTREGSVLASPAIQEQFTSDVMEQLRSGEPLLLPAKEPSEGQRIFVPGMANDRLVGVLFAEGMHSRQFHASAQRFLRGLAERAALASENLAMISELQRSNESLAQANRKLKELDVLKSKFLSVATHELRTPLSVMLGYNAMIEESAEQRLTSEERGLLRESLAACKRLIRLVNSMLDLSQIQSGSLRLQFEPADLGQSLESVVSLLEADAHSRRLNLQLRINGKLPRVEMDPERIEQVLVNLLGNALKFTDADGSVVVEAEAVGQDAVEVRVRDTGIGIAPEYQAQIFDEFARVRNGKAMDRPGSGLGLAIARRIVEAHGGELSVTSSQGVGSTFRVHLPLRQRVKSAVCA